MTGPEPHVPHRPPPMTAEMMAEGRARRARGQRQRSRAIADVAVGNISPHDVVLAAAQPYGRPLLRLRLRTLLGAQPGWGARRVNGLLSHIDGICPLPADREVEVRWILDPRSGGRRFLAWIDAWRPKRAPWPDFPYAERPPSETAAEAFARTGLGPEPSRLG